MGSGIYQKLNYQNYMQKEKKLTTEQKLKDMNVTVLNSKPQIFDLCEKEFGISWDSTIFAVKPHIHAKFAPTDDVIEHELVHIRQQGEIGVDNWWKIYFDDPPQRLKWELEAYKHQYQFLKRKNTMNKATLFTHVHFWASNLSGKSYGYLISLQEAVKEIIT